MDPPARDLPALAGMTLAEARRAIRSGSRLDPQRDLPATRYTVDPDGLERLFGQGVRSVRELLGKTVTLLGSRRRIFAPTLTGCDPETVRIVPYAWGAETQGFQPQQPLAQLMRPGELFVAVMHRNADQPDFTTADRTAIKLGMTHMRTSVAVGLPDGATGIAAVDSPRSYALANRGGTVGLPDYPPVWYRLRFPEQVSPAEARAYLDNVRTWMMLVNKVSKFPVEYDGNDNLGTHTVALVREFGDAVLDALAGDPRALAWIRSDANLLYCSEAFHVALNLGLQVPLAREHLGARFDVVERIVAGGADAFWRAGAYADFYDNAGDYVRHSEQTRMIDLALAPGWLRPIHEITGKTDFGGGLAIPYWTVPEMIEATIQALVPRQTLGERPDVARTQAAILRGAERDLYASLGIGEDERPPPRIERLFRGLVEVLERTHGSYGELQRRLRQCRADVAALFEPDAAGAGALIPPSLFARAAVCPDERGQVRLELVAAGVHDSAVRRIRRGGTGRHEEAATN